MTEKEDLCNTERLATTVYRVIGSHREGLAEAVS